MIKTLKKGHCANRTTGFSIFIPHTRVESAKHKDCLRAGI